MYYWEQIAGPPVKLDVTSQPGHAVFDVPQVQIDNTKLKFKLSVEDNKSKKSENIDSVTITISNLDNDSGHRGNASSSRTGIIFDNNNGDKFESTRNERGNHILKEAADDTIAARSDNGNNNDESGRNN